MDRRELLASAGQWLRGERERQGMTVRQLAAALDVATQVVYGWQNGKNAVSDANAAHLAELWGLPELEVRRNLGLWVPDEANQRTDGPAPQKRSDAELLGIIDRLQEEIAELRQHLQGGEQDREERSA